MGSAVEGKKYLSRRWLVLPVVGVDIGQAAGAAKIILWIIGKFVLLCIGTPVLGSVIEWIEGEV